MAIAFDTAVEAHGTSALIAENTWAFTYSHTCTGSNRFLFVATAHSPSFSTTSVTYNGVPLTRSDQDTFDSSLNELWYLPNPASGANNVVVTTSASTTVQVLSASYTGCSQSGIDNHSVVTAVSESGGFFSQSLTPVADNCWIIWFPTNSGGYPTNNPGTNTTIRIRTASPDFGVGALCDTGGAITPAASTTMQIHRSTGAWDGLMVSVSPPTGTTYTQTLSDSIVVTGSMLRTMQALRSEAITVSDSLLRTSQRTFTEAITATASFLSPLLKAFLRTETLTLTAVFNGKLNGSNVIWTHLSKSIAAVWSHITKSNQ